MTYVIRGLDPAPFLPLFSATEAELVAARARRVTATSDTGFPCRVSLIDARQGELLVLVHHVSNDVAGPFRMAHAVFVREGALRATRVRGEVPTMIDRRTIGLRGFTTDGMLAAAMLAQPGAADDAIRGLFADGEIAYIHAHNAAYGCFLASVERA